MKIIYFLFLFGTVLFYACSKDSNNPNSNSEPTLKVKTLTQNSNDYFTNAEISSDVFILKYDAEDRLVAMNSDTTNITFEYTLNHIKKGTHTLRYSSNGNDSYSYIDYYFDKSSGLLDSLINVDESNTYTARTKYFYNTANLRVKEIDDITDYFGQRIDTGYYEYDSKNNLLSITKQYQREDFQYSDSANFHNTADMIYPENIPTPNLLIAYSYSANSGTVHSNEWFGYKFDTYHRIAEAKDTLYLGHGPTIVNTTGYTYY